MASRALVAFRVMEAYALCYTLSPYLPSSPSTESASMFIYEKATL